MAYKLPECAGRPRRKSSPGKATWPGANQVFRETSASGEYLRDHILALDEPTEGQPLLREVMRDGRHLSPRSLGGIREHCRTEMQALPQQLRELDEEGGLCPVSVSEALRSMALRIDSAQR